MKHIGTNFHKKRVMIERGFTLVELLVSVGIFVFMTALVVVKYGNFNQSILLTDLAYDTSLTIRMAQTYGVSVKAPDNDSSFKHAYGVHFDSDTSNNTEIDFYNDIDDNSQFGGDSELLNRYTIKRGASVKYICFSSGSPTSPCQDSGSSLDILFKRPDPSAVICSAGACEGNNYAQIVLQASDGNTRTVTVLENGQITVED